jgi:hypothetical protein
VATDGIASEAAFDDAWSAGRTISQAEAVALALVA